MPNGVELATAWVRLVPSTDGLQGDLESALGPAADRAGESSGRRAGERFGPAAKLAFAAAAAVVAGAFVATFNTGMEELKVGETINAQTQQLIDNTDFTGSLQQINDYTLALSQVSGISEEDLQEAGNNVLKFGNVSEEAYQQAVASINDMGAAGRDVSGVSNALGRALADPATAAGRLARVGVVLTDQQKAQIDAMVAAGDTAGAQQVILDSLEGTYGGMAEATGGTLQGNLNKLQNAWENLAGDLVALVMPAVSGIVTVLQGVTAWASANQGWVVTIAAVIGGVLVVAFYAWASAIWAANAALLANPITWVVLALVALVAAIVWVATQTTFFQDLWTNVTTVIGAAWDWLWTTVLQPVFAAIGAVFTWLWENVILPVVTGIMIYVGIWAAIFTWLWQSVLSPVIAAIGAAATWLWDNVIRPVVDLIVAYVQVWGAIFTWLYENAVKPAFDAVAAGFNWVWNTIISPVVGFIVSAVSTVGNTVNSVFGGIASFIGDAFQAALGVVRGPINGIIGLVNSAIRGINSLSVTIPDWVPLVGGQHFGLSIPTIPMLADGGTITRSGTVLVGERGPELLRLPTGASVDPDIAGAGGGMPDFVTLVDEDGSLLGRMRVVASDVADQRGRDSASDIVGGRRRG